MIRIRTAALGAALMIGLATTAEAQSGQGQRGDRPRAEQGGRRGNAGMQKALMRGIELTDAQKAQLKELHAKHVEERQALQKARGEGRPDSTEMAAMRSLAERHHAAVRAILTPDQQATFDKNVAELRERGAGRARGEGRGGRRGGQGGGHGQPQGGR